MITHIAASITSDEIWRVLNRAILQKRTLGEETLTDLFLLSLSEKTGKNLIVQDYKKHEEKKNGADWAWWFVDKYNRAIGFRVQAKVMRLDTFNPDDAPEYPMLHYKPKGKGYKFGHQTNRLIRPAVVEKMTPIYCLYTSFNSKFLDLGKCQSRGAGDNLFGVSIVSAYSVQKLHHSEVELSKFFDDVHAFPCMLSAANSIYSLAYYVFERFSPALDFYNTERENVFEPHVFEDAYEVPILRLILTADNSAETIELPDSLSRLTLFRIGDDE